MPVEFIGMISPRLHSELSGPIDGPPIDRTHLDRHIRVHEEGEFDRVLIGYFAGAPDGWAIASYAASMTDRLSFLLAHRPGFVFPTVAARKAATVDFLSGGRFALHIITGGNDLDQQRDGDYLPKAERYARTSEFLDIVRQDWASDEPFDYQGRYYQVTGAFSTIKSIQPQVPIYFGGSSEEGLAVAARHADVWATWGEPLAEVETQIADLHRRAEPYGRRPGVSISFRPIMASTEEKAWDRAHQILERTKFARGGAPPPAPANAGSQRLLDAAKGGDVADERLYTAIAEATGARGNTTSLVGTPEQVAEAMLKYYDIGCTTILIRGYNPMQDAIDYGHDLLPIVREEVRLRDLRAQNEASRAGAEAAARARAASPNGAAAPVPTGALAESWSEL